MNLEKAENADSQVEDDAKEVEDEEIAETETEVEDEPDEDESEVEDEDEAMEEETEEDKLKFNFGGNTLELDKSSVPEELVGTIDKFTSEHLERLHQKVPSKRRNPEKL